MPVATDAKTGASTSNGSDGRAERKGACDGGVNGSFSRGRQRSVSRRGREVEEGPSEKSVPKAPLGEGRTGLSPRDAVTERTCDYLRGGAGGGKKHADNALHDGFSFNEDAANPGTVVGATNNAKDVP